MPGAVTAETIATRRHWSSQPPAAEPSDGVGVQEGELNSVRLTIALIASLLLPATFAGRQPVPLDRVQINDAFWSPWLERNREVTLPHILRLMDETGVRAAFAKAAGKGEPVFVGFHNSDEVMYKTLEAAAYELLRRPDPQWRKLVEALAAEVIAAQEPDGYLCTPASIFRRMGRLHPRFPPDRPLVHELYLFGHLYEAAVAHFRATGSRRLLEAALKNADLVCTRFGPGRSRDVPNHPNIEQALITLYEVTGERRYLEQAKFFVDERGRADGHQLWGAFAQDHRPVTEQAEAVGQVPRACYLYSAMADVARHTRHSAYIAALKRLWADVVGRKLYLTGGVGARAQGEAFGAAYELPNAEAYAETCAAIAFMMWNYRMFLLEGEAKYFDVFERTLYNNFLAAVSLRGDAFFYVNPLASDGVRKFNRGWTPREATGPHVEGAPGRKPWFFCPCCPPNWSRWAASLGRYVYALGENGIYVNLFISSRARFALADRSVEVELKTRYPWEGKVLIRVRPDIPFAFPLRIRLPGWALGNPVPSDLYRYAAGAAKPRIPITVNGKTQRYWIEKGYAVIRKQWEVGDSVTFNLPLAPRKVVAHERVRENAGRVALERGPIVYCLEGWDHAGKVLDILIPLRSSLEAVRRPDLLGGVTVLTGRAQRSGGEALKMVAIPYYAWANRGPTEMAVWLKASGR